METTEDRILWGALPMIQPAPGQGARISLDSVLLAHFASPRGNERILELGCSAGGVLLILLRRLAAEGRIGGLVAEGIELDRELAVLAEENARRNGLDLGGRVRFRAGDLRDRTVLGPPQSWDLLLSNPPYDAPGRCLESPRESVVRSRQGTTCSLTELLDGARWALKNRGRLCLVLRADRACELFALLPGRGFQAKRIRFVHARADRTASILLVEAVRAGGPGVSVEPPLFVEDASGRTTRDLLDAYRIRGYPSPAEPGGGFPGQGERGENPCR
jgi:tRNA1(Val) A37 N6-methylase TrmN6